MSDHDYSPEAEPGPDFLTEIIADDPANRRLAGALRSWRAANQTGPVEPDTRLHAMFTGEPAPEQPARWRQLLQRPVVAFGASFSVVLLVGLAAFALVARSGDSPEQLAATTTSALAAVESGTQIGDIMIPDDLTEQTAYATCVADLMKGWFEAGFASEDTPQVIDECGFPPIPNLGPQAEAFRSDLQVWTSCVAMEAQAALPELGAKLRSWGDGNDEHDGLEGMDRLDECGEPPDPRDYGLEFPILEMDPSQLQFGQFDFGELDFENFDLEQLLDELPPGLVPEGFDIDSLTQGLEEFDFRGFMAQLDRLEECELGHQKPTEPTGLDGWENLDLQRLLASLEECGVDLFGPWQSMLGDLEGLEGLGGLEGLENFDLGRLDLDVLIAQLEEGGGFEDLNELLAELLAAEDLDLGSLFDKLAEPDS